MIGDRGPCETCGAVDGVRTYLVGRCCVLHTPAALHGRVEPVPDPDATLEALRASAGIVYTFRGNDSTLNQERVKKGGGRRSVSEQERLDRVSQESRRGQR